MSPYRMIQELNPIIRGWGNYFGIGTLRIFSRIDHYIWYRTWRYLTSKYKKVSRKILIQRYYQGIENPSKRLWHFHGIWEKASKDTKSRKGNISWLLLLSKLVKGLPAHMLRAPHKVLNTPIYIDSSPYEEWSTYIFNRRNSGKSSNNWSDLYKKQKGVCMVCEESLGYLLEENLEIHHVKPLSQNKDNNNINDINNLWLIHKSCHVQLTVNNLM
jgi:RNA-directed DNA polymerase